MEEVRRRESYAYRDDAGANLLGKILMQEDRTASIQKLTIRRQASDLTTFFLSSDDFFKILLNFPILFIIKNKKEEKMNRTQRAVKKVCHKAFDHAKREKRQALYESKEVPFYVGTDGFGKKAEKLKSAVRNEKSLKVWHRKMVQDYAGNNSIKEVRTA